MKTTVAAVLMKGAVNVTRQRSSPAAVVPAPAVASTNTSETQRSRTASTGL